MSDELKAAAERSTRDCLLWYFGSTDPSHIREQMEKLLRVQGEHKAYLAERERREKEDAEPVTVKKLVDRLGFDHESYPGIDIESQTCSIKSKNGQLSLRRYWQDGNHCWYLFPGTVQIPAPKTIADARRLLEALGIERKGG